MGASTAAGAAGTETSEVFGASASGAFGAAGALGAGLAVPPRRMALSLRFMARHMTWVSSRPEAPTMPPTATSIRSPTAMPAMPPATPDREFSREMVMGMSAPPTRTEKATPKKQASRAVRT